MRASAAISKLKVPWLTVCCTKHHKCNKVTNYGLFILPVKFMQNRQKKQRHIYSTGKIVHRLSKSIVVWNILMACSENQKKIFWIVCPEGGSQCNASDAMIQQLTPQKYCNVFKNKVHVAANLRLCTVKFYLLDFKFQLGTAQSFVLCGCSAATWSIQLAKLLAESQFTQWEKASSIILCFWKLLSQ